MMPTFQGQISEEGMLQLIVFTLRVPRRARRLDRSGADGRTSWSGSNRRYGYALHMPMRERLARAVPAAIRSRNALNSRRKEENNEHCFRRSADGTGQLFKRRVRLEIVAFHDRP